MNTLVKQQVKAAFNQYLDAYFTRRDLNEVISLFSPSVTNIGSGDDELTLNYQQVVDIFTRDRQQCPNPISYTLLTENIEVFSEHSALVIATFNTQTLINNLPYLGDGFRLSMFFNLESNEWKIRHIHFSKGEVELNEGESFPLTQMERRNRILEQVVEERTRELSTLNEELRAANIDIQEANFKFESIFENVSDGIIVFDKSAKRFYMVNRRICDYLGYTREEFLNLWIDNLVPYENKERAFEVLLPEAVDQTLISEAIPFISKSGKLLYFDVSARHMRISNSNYHVAVLRDITHKRLSEQLKNEMEVARKASEAKDLFLANISHEIRTPVTGILGMTEILAKTKLDGQQKSFLNIIYDSSKILLDLINDILDISKIEAGKVSLKEEIFDFPAMLSNIKSMFELQAMKSQLYFRMEVSDTLPSRIRTDKHRVEQVLMNLINNAIKFTEKGGITIKVALASQIEKQLKFHVSITDTGIGIYPEQRKKLFQKFEQLDNSFTRTAAGTGLGLVICKELVQLLGGEIGVESEPLKGSTFWFTFNAENCDQGCNCRENEEVSVDNIFFDADLMVVDDKFVNQKVISLMLQNMGCRVDVAKNGQDALELYKPQVHKLIFMDIMMPVMDGITSMQEFRKTHQNLPPIIALTANAMQGDAEKYINLGFDGYLSKPVTEQDLFLMVKKWLCQKKKFA